VPDLPAITTPLARRRTAVSQATSPRRAAVANDRAALAVECPLHSPSKMRIALSLVTAVSIFALANEADAGVRECGGLRVKADTRCKLTYETSCEGSCDLPAALSACAAELQEGCSGGCDVEAEVSCTTSCGGACEAQCITDPGAFDCSVACEADCAGDCNSRCAGDDDAQRCVASCEASCSAECDASCEATPPDADCVAQCESCCGGSCTALVNLDCQIECQAEAFVGCQEAFVADCVASCDTDGSLFCDGQYVAANDLDACIDALEERGVEIDVGFDFTGTGDLFCAVSPESRGVGLLVGLLGLGIVASGRGRRRG
jgi:hypothetical protein